MKKPLFCLILSLCAFAAQALDYDRVKSVTLNGRDALESVDVMALPASFWEENGIGSIEVPECPGPILVLMGGATGVFTLAINEEKFRLENLFLPTFKGYGKAPLHAEIWRVWDRHALQKTQDRLLLDTWRVSPFLSEAEFLKQFPDSARHQMDTGRKPAFASFPHVENEKAVKRYWVQIGSIPDYLDNQFPGIHPGVFFDFAGGRLIRVWIEGYGTEC